MPHTFRLHILSILDRVVNILKDEIQRFFVSCVARHKGNHVILVKLQREKFTGRPSDKLTPQRAMRARPRFKPAYLAGIDFISWAASSSPDGVK
jgi:hypothetical protein